MANHASRITHHDPTPRQLVSKLLAWFAANARDLPWRRTRDPYAIWVSEIMLQQTQVKTVIPYWERWMRELPTIESLAKARPEKIHKLWEGLGYYTRVRNMQKAAQQIVAKHDGKFPEQFGAILALSGIGRYTAGAIASIAFNQPAPILDGNVIRVLTRLHGIGEDPQQKQTNARLWQLAGGLVLYASRLTPHAARRLGEIKSKITIRKAQPHLTTDTPHLPCSALNQSLMELGALICTPRSPNCPICPVAKYCVALRENRIEELPLPKQRSAVIARRFLVFILEHDGRFLIQQRADDVVNAHLWEFPNVEIAGTEGKARHSVRAALLTWASGAQRTNAPIQSGDIEFVSTKPLCVVKHSITRYRMTTEAYRVSFGAMTSSTSPQLAGVWRTPAQLRKLPFTSAHRRIATQLEKVRRAN